MKMKQSDPLELVESGTLARPGLVGRLLRLTLGLACLWGLWNLSLNLGAIIAVPVTAVTHPTFAMLTAMCFAIINYVVNIGFSRSWGRRPAYASLAGFLVLAVLARVIDGDFNSPILGAPLFAWLAYFYGHLGASFLLASVLATPGCEMRAIPELIGRLNGQAAAEHHCPASFITKIDAWERRKLTA